MITPATEILNQKGTPMFNSDLFANRPAAGIQGRIFISTDTKEFYRDTGSTWELIGGPGAGTVTGNGTINVLPIWTSTTGIGNSSISEDATFVFSSKSIKSNAFITNGGTSSQFVKGDGTLDSSTYVSGSGSSTRIAFWSGTNSLTSSNNLFWDNTNGYLGINTNTPGAAIDAHGVNIIAQLNGITNSNAQLAFQSNGTGKWRLGNVYSAGSNYFRIEDIDSGLERIKIENIGLFTLTASQKIDGNGLGSGGYLAFKQFASTQASDIGYTGLSALSTDIFSLSFYQSGTGGGAIYRTIRFSAASIANSATRTFTFPNASGTIALTADLASYLPLAGGTLTGNLNGTNATFSGTLTSGGIASLGTTSATDLLYIGDRTTINTKYLKIYRNSGVTDPVIIEGVNGGIGPSDFSLQVGAGKLGIGTQVPKDKVHINGTLQIGYVDALNDAIRIFWNGASSYGAIQTASSSALALNPSGNNVLIASTIDNGNKLQVNGSTFISANLSIGGNGNFNKIDIDSFNRTALNSSAGGLNQNYNGSTTGQFQTIGFSWSSSIGNYVSYWGMAFQGTNFGSGIGDLILFSGGAEGMRMSGNDRSVIFSNTIQTSSPSGGTARPFKLGSYVAGITAGTGYVQVEINGVVYKLIAST